MFKLDFEKTEEPEIKSPTSVVVEKAREFQKNIYFCFIDYTKAFECVNHNKLWKILQEMGIPDHLICLLRNLYAGQELDMKQQTGSKLGKEYVKDVYCHPAYLMYIQSTSSEKAMEPHSSTLAWKIPWTEKPARLQSMGWLGVGHD